MATKKNTKKTDYEKIYYMLLHDADDILFRLYELKDEVFSGEMTHKDTVHQLFDLCSELDNAIDKVQKLEYND
jgi:hypothetical protein